MIHEANFPQKAGAGSPGLGGDHSNIDYEKLVIYKNRVIEFESIKV